MVLFSYYILGSVFAQLALCSNFNQNHKGFATLHKQETTKSTILPRGDHHTSQDRQTSPEPKDAGSNDAISRNLPTGPSSDVRPESRSLSPTTSSETISSHSSPVHVDGYRSGSPRISGDARANRSPGSSRTSGYPSDGKGFDSPGSPSSVDSHPVQGDVRVLGYSPEDPVVVSAKFGNSPARQANFPEPGDHRSSSPYRHATLGSLVYPNDINRSHFWQSEDRKPNRVAVKNLSQKKTSSLLAANVGRVKVSVDARKSRRAGAISTETTGSPRRRIGESLPVPAGTKVSKYYDLPQGTQVSAHLRGKGNIKLTRKKTK